jgi:hypothetical protein
LIHRLTQAIQIVQGARQVAIHFSLGNTPHAQALHLQARGGDRAAQLVGHGGEEIALLAMQPQLATHGAQDQEHAPQADQTEEGTLKQEHA